MTAVNPPAYIQASSHPADGFRRAIQTAMRGGYGVFNAAADLLVSANGTPNMTVNVAAGRAVIPGTQNTVTQGVNECLNDATVNLNIAAAHATLPRNDLVVASVQDAQYSGAANQWLPQVITGVAASSPADPAVPVNSITLARVRVDAAVGSIVSGKITDLRPTLAGTAQLSGQYVQAGGNGGGVGSFTAASRFLGMLAAMGPPSSGTYLAGDWGFDSKGAQWVCTAAGTPGTWQYAGGGPYRAKARGTAATTLPAGTSVKVALQTEDFDLNANFDNVTNYRYTVAVPGCYVINGMVSRDANAVAGTLLQVSVRKNGADIIEATNQARGGGAVSSAVSVSTMEQLAAGDYLELWAYQDDSVGRLTLTGAGQWPSLSVSLVG